MYPIEQKLSRIDLNLLVSFNVLLQEKNVSRAAEILHLSQSAMSRILQRLRDTFDDPLFYRTSDGIIPSEKAQRIGLLIPNILNALDGVFDQDLFQARNSQAHFAISLPSIIGPPCILPLFKQLAIEAPLMSFTEHAAKTNPFALLESGVLDYSLYTSDKLPNNFISTYIGNVDLAVFARKEHPLCQQESVNINDCLTHNFLSLITDNDANKRYIHPVDKILENYVGVQAGNKRNVVFSSNQLQVIFDILKSTDNLLFAPSNLLLGNDLKQSLQPVLDLNLPETERIKFYLIEHKRIENSKAHAWFKQKLLKHLAILDAK